MIGFIFANNNEKPYPFISMAGKFAFRKSVAVEQFKEN